MNVVELIKKAIKYSENHPEDKNQTAKDVITAAITQVSQPRDWQHAKPTLVELRIPEQVGKMFEEFGEISNASPAELESAYFTDCVLFGLQKMIKTLGGNIKKYNGTE